MPIANNDDLACLYCWQWANFTMGPNEQNQHFAELRQKSMFMHTRGSAPKRSAKFGRQKRTFCGKKEEKAVSQIKSDRL